MVEASPCQVLAEWQRWRVTLSQIESVSVLLWKSLGIAAMFILYLVSKLAKQTQISAMQFLNPDLFLKSNCSLEAKAAF